MELLPLLLKEKLLDTVPLRLVELAYPRSYDPNTKCDFHGGVIGHPTEKCWGFEAQDHGPNVKNNPLPAHKGISINAISHEDWEEESKEV
ncbi:hypothetical protein CR513_53574, partial [Mucuna pruriens]